MTLHAQALELVLRRAGLRTLSLTPATIAAGSAARSARSTRALSCCTGGAPLDDVARLIYAVRSARAPA